MEIRPVSSGVYVGDITGRGRKKQSQATEKRTSSIVMDDVKISREAQEQRKTKQVYDRDWIAAQLKAAEDQAASTQKSNKIMSNCQRIAARVMAGDIVPPQDLKYLMEHDGQTYQMAMVMRKTNPDPKRHDRISEEDENTAGRMETASTTESGGSTSPEAPPPVAGTPVAE